MLKQTIASVINEIFTLKVVVMLLVFGILTATEVGFGQRQQFTAMEFMIHGLTDHFYLIHIYPLFYLVFLNKLKKNREITILVRRTSFFDYWKYEILGLSLFTATLVMLHVLVSSVFAFINFPPNLSFTEMPLPANSSALVLYRSMGSPIQALLKIIGFQLIGSVYLGTLIRWLELYFNEKTIAFISMISILMAVAAVKTGWDDSFPYISIQNYFILHHPLAKGVSVEILIIMCVGFILMTLIAKKGWGVKRYV